NPTFDVVAEERIGRSGPMVRLTKSRSDVVTMTLSTVCACVCRSPGTDVATRSPTLIRSIDLVLPSAMSTGVAATKLCGTPVRHEGWLFSRPARGAPPGSSAPRPARPAPRAPEPAAVSADPSAVPDAPFAALAAAPSAVPSAAPDAAPSVAPSAALDAAPSAAPSAASAPPRPNRPPTARRARPPTAASTLPPRAPARPETAPIAPPTTPALRNAPAEHADLPCCAHLKPWVTRPPTAPDRAPQATAPAPAPTPPVAAPRTASHPMNTAV